jgi:hypothetical protein
MVDRQRAGTAAQQDEQHCSPLDMGGPSQRIDKNLDDRCHDPNSPEARCQWEGRGATIASKAIGSSSSRRRRPAYYTRARLIFAGSCGSERNRLVSPDRSADFARRANQQKGVQPPLQKYFVSLLTQITSQLPPSRPDRGALRDRHGRWARDAVDAAALLTNSANADGEVVWS